MTIFGVHYVDMLITFRVHFVCLLVCWSFSGYDDLSTRLGKFCGDHSESFWSSGIYMYVRFVSDSSTQYRGFRLAYRAVSETPPPPIASGTTLSVAAFVSIWMAFCALCGVAVIRA